MTQDTQLFLLDCGLAKASWKAAQQVLFDRARKYDRYIFTRQDVQNFADQLQLLNSQQKNPVAFRFPDWDLYDRYGQAPGLCFGENCYVTFLPITGYFTKSDEA